MDHSRVDFVLVRPSRGANVAAACRALKNMGFARLAVVGEGETPLTRAERGLAYGAWDVLDARRGFASLPEALAGSAFVASTSMRPEGDVWTPRRLARELPERAGSGRVSIVFGPESSGLSNDELALCHATVRIPTAASQASLNLAQAVLVVAYELHVAELGDAAEPERAERAVVGDVEQALAELRESLQLIGYLDPQNPDHILEELRRLIFRAGPSEREVTLLRGLARQMSWAGRRASGAE